VLYLVKWSRIDPRETVVCEYIASAHDAWELWNWLTTRAQMESKYHELLVEKKQTSALFAMCYKPPVIEVRVFEVGGCEVSPENGINGMYTPKLRSQEGTTEGSK